MSEKSKFSDEVLEDVEALTAPESLDPICARQFLNKINRILQTHRPENIQEKFDKIRTSIQILVKRCIEKSTDDKSRNETLKHLSSMIDNVAPGNAAKLLGDVQKILSSLEALPASQRQSDPEKQALKWFNDRKVPFSRKRADDIKSRTSEAGMDDFEFVLNDRNWRNTQEDLENRMFLAIKAYYEEVLPIQVDGFQPKIIFGSPERVKILQEIIKETERALQYLKRSSTNPPKAPSNDASNPIDIESFGNTELELTYTSPPIVEMN